MIQEIHDKSICNETFKEMMQKKISFNIKIIDKF